ncbi:MAG: hypothetical protein AAF573_06545 [Bacteroidota bacterium]
MKKIYWIIAIIALFFVGDRLAGYVLKEMVSASQFRYSKIYRGAANADILLMGNSRGLGFYQPYIEEVTGKKTFNLSYNALPMNLGRALFEDYLRHNQKPEILVLDITMTNRIDTTLVSGFNVYTPYSEKISAIVKDHTQNIYYGGKLSHLFIHNSEIFQRAMFYKNRSDEDWIIDRVINENLANSVEEQRPFYVGPFDSMTVHTIFTALNETVDIARQEGIKVKLVISPFYPPFVKKIVNEDDFIRRVQNETGLRVHNFMDAVQDESGFGDYQHVNIHGAKLFIDSMRAAGIFD